MDRAVLASWWNCFLQRRKSTTLRRSLWLATKAQASQARAHQMLRFLTTLLVFSF